MIEHVNESIERTARLTGLSPEAGAEAGHHPLQNPAVLAGVFQLIEQPPDGEVCVRNMDPKSRALLRLPPARQQRSKFEGLIGPIGISGR